MKLLRIAVKDFRNFREADVSFSPGLNIICGANGQGKTSLIESIYMVSSGKSFRARESTEMIRNGSEYASIDADVRKNGASGADEAPDRYRVFLSSDKKQFMINGAKTATEDFYGDFGCVLMSDRDMLMLRGNPEERRRFIDRAISNTDRLYLLELLRYNRILRQRNALLRRARETRMPVAKLKEELEAWDSQLVESASGIMTKREAFVERLCGNVGDSYQSLFGAAEKLEMTYEPSVKKKLAVMPKRSPKGCLRRWEKTSKKDIPALGLTETILFSSSAEGMLRGLHRPASSAR